MFHSDSNVMSINLRVPRNYNYTGLQLRAMAVGMYSCLSSICKTFKQFISLVNSNKDNYYLYIVQSALRIKKIVKYIKQIECFLRNLLKYNIVDISINI